ncbi:MAG TPA: hypothetical protein VFV75_12170 [Candidatus Polarisedimenticolaceae bacterium]|nr:hypothetical protein [Candidatus Polarisedimenticolaceae bacterium]
MNHENVSDIAPFVHTAPVVSHLNRTETYVLLEAARAPGSVLEVTQLQGSEEALFTAAKRLELDGFLQLIGPFTYQVTRKTRDPRLLAQVALQWIRP